MSAARTISYDPEWQRKYHDLIATPARVDSAAAAGITAGREIEYVLVEGYGHTMVVGGALPGVVTWLMAHRLGSAR